MMQMQSAIVCRLKDGVGLGDLSRMDLAVVEALVAVVLVVEALVVAVLVAVVLGVEALVVVQGPVVPAERTALVA